LVASILTVVYHMLKNHISYQTWAPTTLSNDAPWIAAKLAQRIKDYDVRYSAAA
jgi:hypothetical protein